MHVIRRLLASGLLLTTAFAASADYSGHPRAALLLERLESEHDFGEADLAMAREALAAAEQLPELIKQEQTAPERTLTWTAYRKLHVTEAMIQRGVAFFEQHKTTLRRAEDDFGVAPEVIVAILGVETRYGGFTGRTRVLDALATQAFDHPGRGDFFLSELAAFLALTRETELEPTEPKGSYAGAMGWAQFMPSNYRRLALDYDDDGDIDLWSPADAIGSIARYLIDYDPRSAWRAEEPMALTPRRFQVRADAIAFNTQRPNASIGELAAIGAEPTREMPADMPAGLLELQRNEGREFLIALPNFYAVMRYNPRVFYAMAVGDLAEAISRARGEAAGRFMP